MPAFESKPTPVVIQRLPTDEDLRSEITRMFRMAQERAGNKWAGMHERIQAQTPERCLQYLQTFMGKNFERTTGGVDCTQKVKRIMLEVVELLDRERASGPK